MADEPLDPQAEPGDAPLDELLETAGADDPSLHQPSIAALLREHDYDISDDATDDDVLARMEELEKAAEERDQLRQENEQQRAWLATRQPEQQKPEPESIEPSPESTPQVPGPPEWNEDWEQYLKSDDRGRIVIRKEDIGAVDPQLPQKYAAYKRWERERLKQLLSQSDSLFDESRFDERFKQVEETAYKRALEEFGKQQSQAQVKSFLDQYEDTHSDWLKSGNGLSELGTLFNTALTGALGKGFGPEEAAEYAEYVVQKKTGQSPWSAAEDAEDTEPPPTPQQKRTVLRRRKNNGVNRIAQPPVSRNKGADEILEKPTGRQLADNWAKEMRQAAGIED